VTAAPNPASANAAQLSPLPITHPLSVQIPDERVDHLQRGAGKGQRWILAAVAPKLVAVAQLLPGLRRGIPMPPVGFMKFIYHYITAFMRIDQ
jgi:hypothetical protein